jgi:hypothetical protein
MDMPILVKGQKLLELFVTLMLYQLATSPNGQLIHLNWSKNPVSCLDVASKMIRGQRLLFCTQLSQSLTRVIS